MCDAIAPWPINSIQEVRKHTLLLRKHLIVYRGVSFYLNKNQFISSMIYPDFNTTPLHKL